MTESEKDFVRLQKTFFCAGYIAAAANLSPRDVTTDSERGKVMRAALAEYNRLHGIVRGTHSR